MSNFVGPGSPRGAFDCCCRLTFSEATHDPFGVSIWRQRFNETTGRFTEETVWLWGVKMVAWHTVCVCACVCMWLGVCCYYGESLRWHKLHSTSAKQHLHYLCLDFCLLPASPLPAPPHLSLPSHAKRPPRLALKCKHITTSISYSRAGSGRGIAEHTLPVTKYF